VGVAGRSFPAKEDQCPDPALTSGGSLTFCGIRLSLVLVLVVVLGLGFQEMEPRTKDQPSPGFPLRQATAGQVGAAGEEQGEDDCEERREALWPAVKNAAKHG
jgi:hypothetical protein